MREHLVFTLTAALGAMGELAGHERRGSWTWPGRSAVLGLCAAALGIRRDGNFAAVDGLGLAVAVFDEGEPLRDFHTAVSIPSSVVKRPQSRGEALRIDAGRSNATITLRDYRVGAMYGVALWGEGLEGLRAALLAPAFTLYLGRKSCPLAAPLGPPL
jgi:CRISPR system Cascade subunit CasD